MLITSPVIGFDLDGVILNHTAMKQHIAKQFGFDLNQSETSSEMMYKMIPLEIWHKIQNLLYDNPEFCLKSLWQFPERALKYFLCVLICRG